jgi:hypothetical protein
MRKHDAALALYSESRHKANLLLPALDAWAALQDGADSAMALPSL